MTARIDYLSRTKNRCVVSYTCDGAGGNMSFDVGPSAFGSNFTQVGYENYPVATTGLTYTSAALSRVVASCGGAGGNIEFSFSGATSYVGFLIPYQSFQDKNLERFTIPNLSQGSTGMAQIKNNLTGGQTASIVMEFVTRHV